MRRLKPFIFALALTGIWLLVSSDIAPYQDDYTPYYMKRADLEKSVSLENSPRDMVDPGKIWIAGSTVYIVERYKGVHIIDNSNNAAPRQTGFIIAPGCMDVAVKEGYIYLDNAVDLVAVDLATGRETKRLTNYFPEPARPDNQRHGYHEKDYIIVGWEKTDKQ